MERKEIEALALDVMRRAEVLTLATRGADPYPHLRAILNLRDERRYPGVAGFYADKGLSVFVSTNTSSAKIREVADSPWVSAYYSIPSEFKGVCLSGKAVLDPEARAAVWVEGWEMYYPLGRGDPDYSMLRIDPVRLRGWASMAAFDLEL
jgi:general stress protein 26